MHTRGTGTCSELGEMGYLNSKEVHSYGVTAKLAGVQKNNQTGGCNYSQFFYTCY